MSATPEMREPLCTGPGRTRRVAGHVFRILRILVLLVLLVIIILGLFLNKVGLPESVKERVVDELREKGWDVQFSRLRLRWYRGLVAEHIQLQRTNQVFGPRLFVEEAECRFRHAAFKRLRLEVVSIQLKGGRLIWPLAVTNGHRHTFSLEDVGGELMFRAEDRWDLRNLRCRGFGAQLDLSGRIDHASALRDWKQPIPAAARAGAAEIWLRRLERIAQQVKFSSDPQITGTFQGDAMDLRSFQADLKLSVDGVNSPWVAATNILLAARLIPPAGSNEAARVEFDLGAQRARTTWGEVGNLQLQVEAHDPLAAPVPATARLTAHVSAPETRWGRAKRLVLTARFYPDGTNAALRQTDLKAVAEHLHTGWGQANSAQLTLHSTLPLTNLTPAAVTAELLLDQSNTRWGVAQQARFHLDGVLPSFHSLGQTNLAWPDRLRDIQIASTATLTNLQSPQLRAETVSLGAKWNSPRLEVQVSGKIGDGDVAAKVELNATNRELAFGGSSSFDPNRITGVLTTNAQRWMARYSWESPPRLEASGRLTLPDSIWTNQQPDWRGEVLPTLSVAGQFQVGAGAYRGVTFNSARSPFAFSNNIWSIPGLRVSRPEGDLEGAYTSDVRSRDFHWSLRSRIDPKAVTPLFEKETQRRAFDYFEFTVPPVIQAEIWANWLDLDRLGVVAQASATNFTFRGEPVQDCSTRFHYTNRFLAFLDPRLQRAGEWGAAPGVGIDLATQKLYLTNAFGNLNPQVVARAISRKAGEAIEPYQFSSSPTGQVHGVVDLKRQRNQHDLHFEVAGGPFQWKLFHFQQVSGNIHWVGEILALTNVQGILHEGSAAGSARFDFAADQGADFSFNLAMAEANLHTLAADLKKKTNTLEGLLSGELFVTRANSSDWKSWQGHGRVGLRDGLIWDIPLFGVFSPILNMLVPGMGLGNSRAREGTAHFVISNSVIHTEDLDIRATAMRMHFEGAFDFDRRVDGRMEAELLRDVPAIGFFISKILWPVTKLFEYKVTGSLDQPKTEPLYTLPKLLLMPFHPFRTLKELFPLEEKGPSEKPPPK